jgi:hypothetical protein
VPAVPKNTVEIKTTQSKLAAWNASPQFYVFVLLQQTRIPEAIIDVTGIECR